MDYKYIVDTVLVDFTVKNEASGFTEENPCANIISFTVNDINNNQLSYELHNTTEFYSYTLDVSYTAIVVHGGSTGVASKVSYSPTSIEFFVGAEPCNMGIVSAGCTFVVNNSLQDEFQYLPYYKELVTSVTPVETNVELPPILFALKLPGGLVLHFGGN